MNSEKKAIWGWVIYDWANSAFATTVIAGFFPIFFKQYWSHGADINMSTAQLGLGNSLAGLFVALIGPILGAIADRGCAKKKFLLLFAFLGVLMTAGLFLIQKGQWTLAIVVYIMGVIGFSGANVFYDSILPDITGQDKIDYVSSLGYSMGYLGGGLLFLINALMVLRPEILGFASHAAAMRFSFLSVALWWGLFTLFTIAWVPEKETSVPPETRWGAITAGFRQLHNTFKKIRHLKTVIIFLLAYWCYIDGVDTIIRMAVDYGLCLGFASADLITALLLVQFIGFPATLAFGRMGRRWGVRKAIYLAMAIYMGVVVWGVMMTKKYEFYILAVVIGLVQGGIQALSRSYYSRLIPLLDQAAEYYGFYNMLGKFAVITGPALMGLAGLLAHHIMTPPSPTAEQLLEISQMASRWGIASTLLLFIAGGVLFYLVDEEKGREQARLLSMG